MNVAAKDKGTGKEQSISITGASTLPKDDVERMVKEAERNAAADKERREKIDRKNQADSLAYQAEKQLKELGDKVPAADKTKAEGLIKDLKDAVAKEDDERIKTLMPELQQTLYSIGSNIYQQAGGGAAPGGDGGAGGDPRAAHDQRVHDDPARGEEDRPGVAGDGGRGGRCKRLRCCSRAVPFRRGDGVPHPHHDGGDDDEDHEEHEARDVPQDAVPDRPHGRHHVGEQAPGGRARPGEQLQDDLVMYDSKDLVTHGVVLGMTGSGKTGLGAVLLEEAARRHAAATTSR